MKNNDFRFPNAIDNSAYIEIKGKVYKYRAYHIFNSTENFSTENF